MITALAVPDDTPVPAANLLALQAIRAEAIRSLTRALSALTPTPTPTVPKEDR